SERHDTPRVKRPSTVVWSRSPPRVPCRSEVLGRLSRRDLVMVDEIRGSEDEHLAHHVRVLLVAAHKADHAPAGRMLDHSLEALAHQLLELHPLLNNRHAP